VVIASNGIEANELGGDGGAKADGTDVNVIVATVDGITNTDDGNDSGTDAVTDSLTVMIAVLGIEAIYVDGTVSGTADQLITTNDGDDDTTNT
jgi:hypothetical protein